MEGTPQDSLRYCTKEDKSPFIHGELPEPGKRSDLRAAASSILSGSTIRQLALQDEDSAVAVVKYYKGLTVLRSLTRPARDGFPKIFWIWGETGVGKTQCAFHAGSELAPGGADDVWFSPGNLRWFDGYDGQHVAIFDDFRAKQVTSFAFFLRLLDRYPIDVEIKGAYVKFTPSVIFITCPKSPDDEFEQRKLHRPEDIEQLKRRIRESGGAVINIKTRLTTPGAVVDLVLSKVRGDDNEEPRDSTSVAPTTSPSDDASVTAVYEDSDGERSSDSEQSLVTVSRKRRQSLSLSSDDSYAEHVRVAAVLFRESTSGSGDDGDGTQDNPIVI